MKPDWRDNTGLLGYWNPVTGQYEATRFLRMLLAASEEFQARRPPAAGDSLEGYIRHRLKNVVLREQLQRHRERLQEVAGWRGSWTDQQLRTLWLDRYNDIGFMQVGEDLDVGYDLLRQATDMLIDRRIPLAQRALAVQDLLLQAGLDRPPVVRIIRVLATLSPDDVPAIGSRSILRDAGRALRMRVRLRREPESTRWSDLAEAWPVLREASRPLMEALDLDPADGAAWTLVLSLAREYARALRRGAEPEADDEAGEEESTGARPYIIVLDEMNLARVEYYLADILSVLETGREDDGLTRGAIALHGQAGSVTASDGLRVPPTLRLPPNLYLVGTINTDETTFAFSPKVLDRAFTMEVREVDLAGYPPEVLSSEEDGVDEALLADFTRQGRFAQLTRSDVAGWGRSRRRYVALLDELNQALLPYDLGFGYRVVDEILAFMGAVDESPMRDVLLGDSAFDVAVMMKVLPKFHGAGDRLEQPLKAVVAWAGERFPRVGGKARGMLERARLVGDVRFAPGSPSPPAGLP